MKSIRLLYFSVLLLISATAFGQIAPPNYYPDGKRIFQRSIYAFESFNVPKVNVLAIHPKGADSAGAIVFNTVDSSGYDYTGHSWSRRLYWRDSTNLFITQTRLKDSIATRVRYTDTAAMLTGYTQRNELKDSVINKVKYIDTASMLSGYPRRNELKDTAAAIRGAIGTGGGSATYTKEGLSKRGDTIVIDNNRNIYYITQQTSGSSLATGWTAVGTPTYTVTNGIWQFGGNADNNTQYIHNNNGVLSSKCFIEAYVIVDSLRTSSIGPRIAFKSYNPFSGGIYKHDVEAGLVTGSAATNSGKAIIFGKTGSSTNVSDSARSTFAGDTLYFRLDRDGLSYTIRVENLTRDWKLQKSVQTTPNGTPFVAHNSSYVAFIPGGGGYKVYGFRYVIKAPIQTDLCINGDSQTQGQGSPTEGSTYSAMIGNPANNIIQGGGADGVSEMYARVGEIIAIHPTSAPTMIGGNDVLFDGSLTTTTKNEYTAIRDSLVAHGIAFIHILPTPRTATDLSSLKNWIDTSSNFRSDIKIDGWNALLGSGTSLLAKYDVDGTHFNDAGAAKLASTANTTLHYSNSDAMYVAGNLYAWDGIVSGRTTVAISGDHNNYGGIRAYQAGTSKTSYITMGKEATYGVIEARREGTANDPIVISPMGPSVNTGIRETSPTATLDIKNSASGSTSFLSGNHAGSYSAEGQELRFDFQNAHSTVTRMANFLGASTSFGFKWYTYSGGALNSTPAITAYGISNKVGINNAAPLSTLDVTGAFRVSDTTALNGAVYIPSAPAATSVDSIHVGEDGRLKIVTASQIVAGANVVSSTYTPTASGATGGSVVSVEKFIYQRSGNTVSFSGYVSIDPTADGSIMQFFLTLPVASNFAGDYDGSGTLGCVVAGSVGQVQSDATQDKIVVSFVGGAGSTAGLGIRITGHYEIL